MFNIFWAGTKKLLKGQHNTERDMANICVEWSNFNHILWSIFRWCTQSVKVSHLSCNLKVKFICQN